MSGCLEDLVQIRRSIYSLGHNQILELEEIVNLVESALTNCPSAFNSQSGRVVVLFGQYHQMLWDLTTAALEQVVPAEQFSKTAAKISTFAAGYGTVLYFIDEDTTRELQEKFPLYADKFPIWAEQAMGMLQYIVWTMLAEHDVGASLQHYNPLIDDQVRATFQIPESWRLSAEMPFGSITAPAQPKTYLPIDERLKIFGLSESAQK